MQYLLNYVLGTLLITYLASSQVIHTSVECYIVEKGKCKYKNLVYMEKDARLKDLVMVYSNL